MSTLCQKQNRRQCRLTFPDSYQKTIQTKLTKSQWPFGLHEMFEVDQKSDKNYAGSYGVVFVIPDCKLEIRDPGKLNSAQFQSVVYLAWIPAFAGMTETVLVLRNFFTRGHDGLVSFG